MDELLIEADVFASFRFNQRATDQQRVLQHELQRILRALLLGNDFTGFDMRCGAVEPFGHGAFAEKFQQALLRPGFGEQVTRDDFVAGGGEQRLLSGVVAAAGFFVEVDGGHGFAVRIASTLSLALSLQGREGTCLELHQDVFIPHDELAGQAPRRGYIAGLGGGYLVFGDLAG